MIRIIETKVRMTEQTPGPSSHPCLPPAMLLSEPDTGTALSDIVFTEKELIISSLITDLIRSLVTKDFSGRCIKTDLVRL